MRVDFSEFRAAYLAEVDEHLSAAHQRLAAIAAARREQQPQGRELRELMRLLHTIKGLSSMVGVDAIVDIAHEMEGVVRGADQAGTRLEGDAIDTLISALRAIEQRVGALAKNEPVEAASPSLLHTLTALVGHTAPAPATATIAGDPDVVGRLSTSEREQLVAAAASGKRAVRVDFAPSPRKADAGISIATVRDRLSKLGELVKVMPIASASSERTPSGLVFALFVVTGATDDELAKIVGGTEADVTTIVAAATTSDAPPPSARPPLDIEHDDSSDMRRAGFLRVDVGRVDETIEKLGALIVTRSRLAAAAGKLRAAGADTRELDAVLADVSRQLRDLRGAILSVRMVPLTTVLDRLPLVVRGLERTSGKRVRLVIEAGSAELDKTVAERLFPAFVQIVRNAVDHGIEAPAAREATGKRAEGTIVISAVALGNRFVEVRIADDGAGIDASRVAARERVSDVPRTSTALLDVLCRPGFSTRDAADQRSGRGVGMDIVKRTIEALGGTLVLETEPGRGTTFAVRVPLTIAVVDAFTVSCAGKRFAVPVPAVAEIVEVDPASMAKSPSARGVRDVRLFARRGETLALVDLASALGIEQRAMPSGARHAFVIRRSTGEAVAFAIDRVTGQQETVVRPIEDPLVTTTGVAGSTDLGDGQPTLVLDLLALSAAFGGAA